MAGDDAHCGVVLIVEDDATWAGMLSRALEQRGYSTVWHPHAAGVDELVEEQEADVVVTDLYMPGEDGLSLVTRLRGRFPKVPVIVMTGASTTESAIEAMKAGAFEYLAKPFGLSEMVAVLEKAMECRRTMTTRVALGKREAGKAAIVGKSAAMLEAFKQVGRVASLPLTVLVRGETGTGKELFARAIYQHSDRSHQTFLAVNCAAIPETLLESELFGYEKGAFTGAQDRRIGKFEQCSGGTLFLDEVAELTLGTQAKLLRVLQDRSIQRLGGRAPVPVDVRIVAATNRSLEGMVREGRFREDLYHRLDVVTIHIPPLRERREDIPDLALHFLDRCSRELRMQPPTIAEEAMGLLVAADWPGNVRQMENVLRRALIAGHGLTITAEAIQAALRGHFEAPVSGQPFDLASYVGRVLDRVRQGEVKEALPFLSEQIERELYRQAIVAANGNHSRAAAWIGVSRVTFNRKLQSYGLEDASSWVLPESA